MSEKELNKAQGNIPYIGKDLDGDGIIDTIPVQLSGSIVEGYEEITAVEMGTYTEDVNGMLLSTPKMAKGVIVETQIDSLTGDNPEYALQLRLRNYGNGNPIAEVKTDYSGTAARPVVVCVYPSNMALGDGTIFGDENDFKSINIPVTGAIRADLLVKGEFETGEGIAGKVIARWLF